MGGKSMPKRVVGSNIIGNRHLVKPKKGRGNAAEIVNKENLKARRWIEESVDRQTIWRRHLREAGARLRDCHVIEDLLIFNRQNLGQTPRVNKNF
jgi:hypothetical protein